MQQIPLSTIAPIVAPEFTAGYAVAQSAGIIPSSQAPIAPMAKPEDDKKKKIIIAVIIIAVIITIIVIALLIIFLYNKIKDFFGFISGSFNSL